MSHLRLRNGVLSSVRINLMCRMGRRGGGESAWLESAAPRDRGSSRTGERGFDGGEVTANSGGSAPAKGKRHRAGEPRQEARQHVRGVVRHRVLPPELRKLRARGEEGGAAERRPSTGGCACAGDGTVDATRRLPASRGAAAERASAMTWITSYARYDRKILRGGSGAG